MRDYIYSDLNKDLRTDVRGNVEVLYNEDTIIQSIKNIMATVSNERVRSPIGSSLVAYLFEPISNNTAQDIKSEIRDMILAYEPRVHGTRIQVIADTTNHSYDVRMSLKIKNINRPIQFNTRLRSLAESF